MSLTQGVHRAVQQSADKIATVFGERRRSYAQLAERAARLAGGLQALGVAAGDRVAMLALNSDRYLEYFVGTWWAGAAVNPLNTRWSAVEMAYALRDCDTQVLFVDEAHAGMLADVRAQAPCVRTVIHVGEGAAPAGTLAYEDWLAAAPPAPDACAAWDSLAAILYTGGTTGFPKGVMLSHMNLWSSAIARMAQFEVPRSSVTLLVPPLFHTAALGRFVSQLVVGGTSVVSAMFRPEAVMRTIAEEGVNDIMLVPSMIQMMLDDPSFGAHDLSGLERIAYGASPMSMGLLERAMAAWPHAGFYHAYGMTETAPVISINPPANHTPRARERGLHRSAGRASYAVEVRIVDAEGREVPRGTVGEIVARGPNVMMGYWKQPEATAEALRDGWMHTGDGAYMDDEGYLYVVDRIKDMIVTGGENVYSAEVESVLSRHPDVSQCAVIGVPDERWGERVHAVVVPRAGANIDLEALREFCRERLAGYKLPRSLDAVDELPMSPAGKVLKQVLRKPYWSGRERNVN
ncbi:long-chain-fatty-acid--CoA ligase [Verticiella sediminum]|uniref:Long-chain-fatty-acid--CoA ligase n=1 Tax=Verticiella sediminum TaxID=1247510 RepID=A0A556AXK7_9BURK|nr:long-chain-fatty-acid--CoA ligase [Verticiella sediminum]TSH97681.1 long-chain-fatty-acid--CoA ligase [Verticiella sediminum]